MLYWAVGYTDIEKTFISHCNTQRKCLITRKFQQEYTAHYPRVGQQQFVGPTNSYVAEYNAHDFAVLIQEKVRVFRAANPSAYSKQRKHEVLSFKREQLPLIPVFFADKVNDNDQIRSVESQYTFDSSIQCFVAPTLNQDGTCRECLAMHSKSFAIRVYFFYYRSLRQSSELFVFPSDHNEAIIISNCEKVFCFQIFALHPRECGIWDKFFMTHRHSSKRLLLTHGMSGDYRNLAVTDEERKVFTKEEVKKMTEHIGLQRMPKIRELQNNKAREDFVLSILRHSTGYICLNIYAHPNRRFKCVNCLLGDENSARLVVFLSLSNAIVLTVHKTILECNDCTTVKPLSSDACQNILGGHLMKMEMYEHTSKLQLLNDVGGKCIVSYHHFTKKTRCIRCMESVLGAEVKHYDIAKNSVLFLTLESDSNLNPPSYDKLLTCHSHSRCSRIQMVPYKFCSDHQSFQVMASSQSASQTKANIFTMDRIPFGVWPPLKHRIVPNVDNIPSRASSLSRSESRYDIEIWPTFNTIALVEFTYAKSKRFDCVKCLTELTEVFLAYTDVSSLNGYVWMRQSPLSILGLCVGVHCLSLLYHEAREQIERPVGLRRLTRDEIFCEEDDT